MQRAFALFFCLACVLCTAGCRDRPVGFDGVEAEGPCAAWSPHGDRGWILNADEGTGAHGASVAVGHRSTFLGAWTGDTGVWVRARCWSGAPLAEAGTDVRLDMGLAAAPSAVDVTSVADGHFAVVWRDDADLSVWVAWVDDRGAPTGMLAPVSTADATAGGIDRALTVVTLSNGMVAVVWDRWVRRFGARGEVVDDAPLALGEQDTLDAAAGPDGSLLQLWSRDWWHFENEISPTLSKVVFDPAHGARSVDESDHRPLLWHLGLRNFVVTSHPAHELAIVTWYGNWPYEVWLRPIQMYDLDDDAETEMLGDGGDNASDEAWIDAATDGNGEIGVVWRQAQGEGRYFAWTPTTQLRSLGDDEGDRPHFPRVAAFPDGGFVVVYSAAEPHPDEDIRFGFVGR